MLNENGTFTDGYAEYNGFTTRQKNDEVAARLCRFTCKETSPGRGLFALLPDFGVSAGMLDR